MGRPQTATVTVASLSWEHEDEGTQPFQLLELVGRLLKKLVDSELSARSLVCSGSLSPLADPAY